MVEVGEDPRVDYGAFQGRVVCRYMVFTRVYINITTQSVAIEHGKHTLRSRSIVGILELTARYKN